MTQNHLLNSSERERLKVFEMINHFTSRIGKSMSTIQQSQCPDSGTKFPFYYQLDEKQ